MMTDNLSPDKICQSIKSCPTLNEPTGNIANLQNGKQLPPSCWKCEIVVNTANQMVEEKGNIEEIMGSLEAVCSKMPKDIKDECNRFLKDYKKGIGAMMFQNLTPDQICVNIGSCPKLNEPLENLIHYELSEVDKQLPPSCWKCEIVVNTATQMVEEKGNKEEIVGSLKSVCSKMPKDIQDECNRFLKEYKKVLASMMTQNLTPDQICVNIRSCPKIYEPSENLSQYELAEINKQEPPSCWKCEIIIHTVDEMVEVKGDKEQIAASLGAVCSGMPKDIIGECNKFLAYNKKIIMDMLVLNLTPDQICENLRSCPSVPLDMEQLFGDYQLSKHQPPTCWKCEIVINTLDQMLVEKGNEQQIKVSLDTVCTKMPKQIETECKRFVEDYRKSILDMMSKSKNPDQICESLGSCPKAAESFILDEALDEVEETTDFLRQKCWEVSGYIVSIWCLAAFFIVLILSVYTGLRYFTRNKDIEHQTPSIARIYPSWMANWNLNLVRENGKPCPKNYDLL